MSCARGLSFCSGDPENSGLRTGAFSEILVSVTVSGMCRCVKYARGGAGAGVGGHSVPTQGASSPSHPAHPTRLLNATQRCSRLDTDAREEHPGEEGSARQSKGARVFLGPWGGGTGGSSPDCRPRCFPMPWSPPQSCEWKRHLAVAIVGEN